MRQVNFGFHKTVLLSMSHERTSAMELSAVSSLTYVLNMSLQAIIRK